MGDFYRKLFDGAVDLFVNVSVLLVMLGIIVGAALVVLAF